MTLQVQRYILETNQWRTARLIESFLDAQVYLEDSKWGALVSADQWAVFEQLGMTLGKTLRGFLDVLVLVNEMGQIIIRTQRPDRDERGHFYICIGNASVYVWARAYTEVKGTFVFEAVPYDALYESIRWIHSK